MWREKNRPWDNRLVASAERQRRADGVVSLYSTASLTNISLQGVISYGGFWREWLTASRELKTGLYKKTVEFYEITGTDCFSGDRQGDPHE
jgi:hypothetical protein